MTQTSFAEVASVAQRLSVLLGAGLAPTSAWRHVADGSAVAAAVAREAVAGEHASAITAAASGDPTTARAWSTIAAAWSVAVEVGAPLAPTLARLAAVLRDLDQGARELELAVAGPRATSRIVLALPPIGVLVGIALGVNALGVLVTTPIGIGCLVLGVALVVVARRWNRRLIASAEVTDPSPGLALDLLAIGLSGGASPERAVTLVDEALRRAELEPLDDAARAQLSFAVAAGVPVASLLRAEADEVRRVALADARTRAVLLGTRLLLPLGLCVLPSFVLLGVVPVAVALVSTTAVGW
jgi:tight adherence protein B